MATPSDAPASQEPVRPRRLRRRLVAAAILVSAAGIAASLLVGGSNAFATWTPKPETLTGAAAARAADTCRDSFPPPEDGAQVVSAERRGEFTYVLIAGPQVEAACLMHDDLVDKLDEAKRGSGFLGTYTADPAAAPTLAPTDIEETVSAQGSLSVPGRLPFTTDDRSLNWVTGYVGSNVTGVTVQTGSGLAIEASIASNRFAAWWPSKQQSSEQPAETWKYTVHLADGSSRSVD